MNAFWQTLNDKTQTNKKCSFVQQKIKPIRKFTVPGKSNTSLERCNESIFEEQNDAIWSSCENKSLANSDFPGNYRFYDN